MNCIDCGNPKVHVCMGDYITSVEQAMAIVDECIATAPPPPPPQKIYQSAARLAMEMARKRNVAWEDVLCDVRKDAVVRCREDIAIALLNHGLSFPEIAGALGRENHSTISTAHKRALKRAKELV